MGIIALLSLKFALLSLTSCVPKLLGLMKTGLIIRICIFALLKHIFYGFKIAFGNADLESDPPKTNWSKGAFVMAPSSASGGAFVMAPSSASGAPNHPPRTNWCKGGVLYGPFLGFGRPEPPSKE